MARSVSKSNPSSIDPVTERCVATLGEVLEDIRAQVYSTNPQLAQLVQLAEHLAGATLLHPEELQNVLDELRRYESCYLSGHERYTRIMRESKADPSQLRWEW